MTTSSTKNEPQAKKDKAPATEQATLCRNCRKDAAAPNQTIATRATSAGRPAATLTDHKLTPFDSAPAEPVDVEYRDFLIAKEQCGGMNTNWKRVREDELENLEWVQNKKPNVGEEETKQTTLDAALDLAGLLEEDLDMEESSQSTATTDKKSSSGNYNFRSRSATRPPSSPGPSTPVDTAENADATTHAKKDVDALDVGKDTARRSATRARSHKSNESSTVTLTELLDSADSQASFETITLSQGGSVLRGKLDPEDLRISKTLLGEGQLGIVRLGFYKGLYVACKSKRQFTRSAGFQSQAKREMLFAAKLAGCRYINRYIGWISCRRQLVEHRARVYSKQTPSLYIIQRYVPNGDARGYLEKRESSFKPQEVLQAAICLFSALTDAHALNIGIVDLKLENFLIDSSGAGWLTDFGSCIEFKEGNETTDLDDEKVAWTEHVAPPEMLQKHEFTKASDVFMATLIVAELMTADISDVDFQNNILQRCAKTGRVSFSSTAIDPMYNDFFKLLKMGLHNNPSQRPTAKAILDYLLLMKD
ncbi:hypothetical protein MBANPS3_003505 [Mucor bainieri]